MREPFNPSSMLHAAATNKDAGVIFIKRGTRHMGYVTYQPRTLAIQCKMQVRAYSGAGTTIDLHDNHIEQQIFRLLIIFTFKLRSFRLHVHKKFLALSEIPLQFMARQLVEPTIVGCSFMSPGIDLIIVL